MNQLFRLIKNHDVISFDVFDTLLGRPFMRPTDLFVHIEQMHPAPGFFAARTSAEAIFYSKNGTARDANIDDIYSTIPEFGHLRDVEIDMELAGLVANTEMKRAYDYARQCGKRIIIASDMYLPAAIIAQALKKNGFDGFEKLYVSNEINRRKDRGDMFEHIIQDMKITPAQMLHIGDNRRSDFEKPMKYGCAAFWYRPRAKRYIDTDVRAKRFWKINASSIDASMISALNSQYDDGDDYWENFGYRVAGPVAYAFAKHIYDIAIQRDLNKVLFVARDGYMARQVFEIINTRGIETEYVYAPRVLNYTANLDFDPKLAEQARIICEYFGVEAGGVSHSEFIEKNIDMFRELARVEKEKTGYSKYIKNAVGNNDVVGVVDTISGQMSGQKLIEKESGVKTVGFYVATIPGRDILNKMEHYDLVSENVWDFLSCNRPDLIELIFSAPENPIITMRDGTPVHQDVPHPAEHIRHDICTRIARGAVAFTRDIMARTNNRGVKTNINTIVDVINNYLAMPRMADMHAMGHAKKSPYADNSEYWPLFSAPGVTNIRKIRNLVWKTPTQRAILILARPISIQMRGVKALRVTIFPGLRRILNLSVQDRYGIFVGG